MRSGEGIIAVRNESERDMMPLRLPLQNEPECAPEISDAAMAFLNHLRFVAMGCRAKPRTALFEACALLQADKSASRDAHAEALMRCLNEALGKPARLHTPGTAELTFDEKWLAQLGQAYGRDDELSCQFLLGSRVARENRRLVGFLVGRMSEYFSLT